MGFIGSCGMAWATKQFRFEHNVRASCKGNIMQGICQEFNVAASRARRPRLTSVGFAPHMIKDKCAAIINDDQCGYTREQG